MLARRIRRQLLERQADEQNTAVSFADGINGPPHPRHNRGPEASSATTTSRSRGTPSLPIKAPYGRHPRPTIPPLTCTDRSLTCHVRTRHRHSAWIQEYDKTAAWLPAFSNVRLGIGEPTHTTGPHVAYDKRFAGYWRIAEIPGVVALPGLPPLVFEEAEEGGYWVATPSMDLLLELWPDWTPQILEAWVWETSKRALGCFYKKVRASRVYIVAAAEAGRPGAKWAKQLNGAMYQSFRGYLGRTAGPQTDHATGAAYAADIYWRPDWAFMLLSHATANMYRNLRDYARDEGITPLYVNVDAAGFASTEADPSLAKPAGMKLGSAGGEWTAENTAPLTELLYAFEDDSKNVHVEVEKYTDEHGQGE